MTDLGALLETVAHAGVQFIIVGGVAATAHGSARVTADLDIVYQRTAENIKRLVAALGPSYPIWEFATCEIRSGSRLHPASGEAGLNKKKTAQSMRSQSSNGRRVFVGSFKGAVPRTEFAPESLRKLSRFTDYCK